MDIGSVLAALALLAAVVAYVLRPLLERRGQAVSREDHEVSVLLAERDRVLSSLQDLEMDQAMGKILDSDYQRQRRDLVEEGAGILRRLDELEAKAVPSGAEAGSSLEDQIEAEVATLREGPGADERARRFCPSCGSTVQPEDRFCTQCGEPLLEGEPS